MPWYYVVLILAGVFGLPVVLGHYISRAVRLPEQSWRIGLVLFALFAGAVVTVWGWPPKLGIDLSGGSILVYEVKDYNADVDMDKLIGAVTLRVNPGGVKEVTIRPYGAKQIEVIIPKATPEELAEIKQKISATGLLEFRIMANRHDHKELIAVAQQLDNSVDDLYSEAGADQREVLAQWVPVRPEEQNKLGGEPILRKNYKDEIQALVVMDDYDVNGGYLESAMPGHDQFGKPCVDFIFNSRGATLFERLTRENLPDREARFERQLAIILDGTLYSAPSIKDVISSRGQITGNFTTEETDFLSEVLAAGSLPTALRNDPSTELVTGPTLGADSIRKGAYSMLVSTVAVVVFMVIYYRFAGVVANLALVLNVLLIVASMILLKAAFTLAGLAGLALTVGMAVDANVLIYERMREELSRGATLRMAIRNGFARATTTIIDANVTTLIAAVVLFAIGTDQVKGFAVTLILGIMMNLFTAIFCSRVLFDIAEKMRWITQLRMLHILSHPNFDFIGKRRLAIAASLVVITIGLAGVVGRGKGILDIDFTGGVSVEVVFEQPQDIAVVRQKLQAVGEDLPDVTVQDVQIEGEERGLRYMVNTSRQDVETGEQRIDAIGYVEDKLKELFPGKLAVNHMTFREVALVEAKKAEKPQEEGHAAPTQDAKPASAPDDKAPPDKKAAPDDKNKSKETQGAANRILRSGDALGLLALGNYGRGVVGPLTALLLQDAPKETPNQPTADGPKPASEAPAAKDAAKPDSAQQNAAHKDAAKPADKAAPTGNQAPAAKSDAAKSDAAKGVNAAPSVPAERYVGGASAKLTFTARIGRKQLESSIRQELVKLDPKYSDVAIELISPDTAFEPGSEAGFFAWNLKLAVPPEQTSRVLKAVEDKLAAQPSFPSSNKIGAAVAGNTQRQAAVALFASVILILVYVWFRFTQAMFGVAAVVALVHDVLVTLGALALSYWLAPYLGVVLVEPFKISLPVVAAFLTIIGYSINDTIVIFDRIREVRGKSPQITPELANSCINQTLSRTILTSLTVFIVVLILYSVGGQGIHAFAFAMVVGIVSGTYSTVYIATPVVLWMNRSAEPPSKATVSDREVRTAAATAAGSRRDTWFARYASAVLQLFTKAKRVP